MSAALAGLAASFGSDEIPPLRPPLSAVPPTFWEQNRSWILLATFLLLALTAVLVRWLMRPRPATLIPPAVMARKNLEPLRGLAPDPELLSKVSRSVREYYRSAFQLSEGELTSTELTSALIRRPEIGTDAVGKVSAFLKRCDQMRFGLGGEWAQGDAAAEALELIEGAERDRERSALAARGVEA